ncbi:hypothetical protein JCM8547_001866 [Rhodosporidiobolus lusitaniae]
MSSVQFINRLSQTLFDSLKQCLEERHSALEADPHSASRLGVSTMAIKPGRQVDMKAEWTILDAGKTGKARNWGAKMLPMAKALREGGVPESRIQPCMREMNRYQGRLPRLRPLPQQEMLDPKPAAQREADSDRNRRNRRNRRNLQPQVERDQTGEDAPLSASEIALANKFIAKIVAGEASHLSLFLLVMGKNGHLAQAKRDCLRKGFLESTLSSSITVILDTRGAAHGAFALGRRLPRAKAILNSTLAYGAVATDVRATSEGGCGDASGWGRGHAAGKKQPAGLQTGLQDVVGIEERGIGRAQGAVEVVLSRSSAAPLGPGQASFEPIKDVCEADHSVADQFLQETTGGRGAVGRFAEMATVAAASYTPALVAAQHDSPPVAASAASFPTSTPTASSPSPSPSQNTPTPSSSFNPSLSSLHSLPPVLTQRHRLYYDPYRPQRQIPPSSSSTLAELAASIPDHAVGRSPLARAAAEAAAISAGKIPPPPPPVQPRAVFVGGVDNDYAGGLLPEYATVISKVEPVLGGAWIWYYGVGEVQRRAAKLFKEGFCRWRGGLRLHLYLPGKAHGYGPFRLPYIVAIVEGNLREFFSVLSAFRSIHRGVDGFLTSVLREFSAPGLPSTRGSGPAVFAFFRSFAAGAVDYLSQAVKWCDELAASRTASSTLSTTTTATTLDRTRRTASSDAQVWTAYLVVGIRRDEGIVSAMSAVSIGTSAPGSPIMHPSRMREYGSDIWAAMGVEQLATELAEEWVERGAFVSGGLKEWVMPWELQEEEDEPGVEEDEDKDDEIEDETVETRLEEVARARSEHLLDIRPALEKMWQASRATVALSQARLAENFLKLDPFKSSAFSDSSVYVVEPATLSQRYDRTASTRGSERLTGFGSDAEKDPRVVVAGLCAKDMSKLAMSAEACSADVKASAEKKEKEDDFSFDIDTIFSKDGVDPLEMTTQLKQHSAWRGASTKLGDLSSLLTWLATVTDIPRLNKASRLLRRLIDIGLLDSPLFRHVNEVRLLLTLPWEPGPLLDLVELTTHLTAPDYSISWKQMQQVKRNTFQLLPIAQIFGIALPKPPQLVPFYPYANPPPSALSAFAPAASSLPSGPLYGDSLRNCMNSTMKLRICGDSVLDAGSDV